MYVYIYIYIHTYTYIYTYIYTFVSQVMHCACFDSRGAGSMMAKLGGAAGHTRASWLDTHPPPPEREARLEQQAVALLLEVYIDMI